MSGQHKVTVIVELGDGTIIQKVKEFSGGNPRFHATEFSAAVKDAARGAEDGIAGIYGDIRRKSAS